MSEFAKRPERNIRALFASVLLGSLALGGCGASKPCETKERLDNPPFPIVVELPTEENVFIGVDSLGGDYSVATYETDNGFIYSRVDREYMTEDNSSDGVYAADIAVGEGQSLRVVVDESDNHISTYCPQPVS